MNPETLALIIQGISSATQLYAEYQAAAEAGDQAALDAIHVRAVAQANALAPAGGVAPVAVD